MDRHQRVNASLAVELVKEWADENEAQRDIRSDREGEREETRGKTRTPRNISKRIRENNLAWSRTNRSRRA